MWAVRVKEFGGPEVLVPERVPAPAAGPGQVVVGVDVADTGFVETQIRRGAWQDYFPIGLPWVPGNAVAGRVLSVGADVDPGWTGRRVATATAEWGGYAEQAVALAETLVVLPDEVEKAVAAALLHDGVTALGVFEPAAPAAGETVLVTAAAGGMGVLLVQLARSAGARVIGAARGAAKLDHLRTYGIDVVDYGEPDWPARVRELAGPRGVSVTFDGAGGALGRAAFELTADGGRMSAHGAPGGGFATVDPREAERRGVKLRGITDVQFAPVEAARLAERALELAAAGRIVPMIGATFPLERAADAHAAIEARSVVGKTVLTVGRQQA
ncbi:zinc-binding dehydrogenase [Actinopolymorpha cephalotaxi]|nr:zinc-binding dehydrogenase [Actinopolymorpha cephalotaxi]